MEPKPALRFCTLRIAFSALCALVAVLLLMLWVRSYWWIDNVLLPTSGTTLVISEEGVFVVTSYAEQEDFGYQWWVSFSVNDARRGTRLVAAPKWFFSSGPLSTSLAFPQWLGVLICSVLA